MLTKHRMEENYERKETTKLCETGIYDVLVPGSLFVRNQLGTGGRDDRESCRQPD